MKPVVNVHVSKHFPDEFHVHNDMKQDMMYHYCFLPCLWIHYYEGPRKLGGIRMKLATAASGLGWWCSFKTTEEICIEVNEK